MRGRGGAACLGVCGRAIQIMAFFFTVSHPEDPIAITLVMCAPRGTHNLRHERGLCWSFFLFVCIHHNKCIAIQIGVRVYDMLE